MAVLFDQAERQCVARVVGTRVPVSLFTPTVKEGIASKERVERYLASRLEKLPFALPMAEARKRLATREAGLLDQITDDYTKAIVAAEPSSAKARP